MKCYVCGLDEPDGTDNLADAAERIAAHLATHGETSARWPDGSLVLDTTALLDGDLDDALTFDTKEADRGGV